MKYFSIAQIQEAIRALRPHHAIFATTFFVLKKEKVPVGRKIRFSLDAANKEFLEQHYRIHPKSAHSFRVLRQGNPKKDWNEPEYAGKGLQSVNTRGCPKAFVHDKNDNTWGWSNNYLVALSEKLPKGIKLPLFHMAVWLYWNKAWADDITKKAVVEALILEYSITETEIDFLFESEVVSYIPDDETFQESPCKWYQILAGYSPPKDVPPDQGGILTYLDAQGVGVAKDLVFEPAKRLNIITGDNGLGKTFLLDLAWWALTQDWADRPAWPDGPTDRKNASLKYIVSGGGSGRAVRAKYSLDNSDWDTLDPIPTISGLVIYARVDGSFAIYDPANRNANLSNQRRNKPVIKLTRDDVWEGKPGQIEGLIRDWVRWQQSTDKSGTFAMFQTLLKRVSPPDEILEIGSPARIPGDVREIPTLKHPYGNSPIPILFESAGIKRIVILAYLIVWAWEEHKVQSKYAGKKEERQMVIIIDEVEAHLHPKWQRVILPAILGVAGDLSAEMAMQLIVTSHSPLVLASSETSFDTAMDKLFHLDIAKSGKVTLSEKVYESRGNIDSWLSSPVFELTYPGSREREIAIKDALRLQEASDTTIEQVTKVTDRLREFLPAKDPFWVRWVFYAEQFGVKV